jgi:hypothetical protein
MDDVVTKISNTVKNINTGKTPIKMSDISPPPLKAPKIINPSNKWDMLSVLKVFLIVVLLTLIGFNVFSYLAQGTNMFSYFISNYSHYIPNGIKNTFNLTEKGTKLGLDVTRKTMDEVAEIAEETTGIHAKRWKNRDKNLEKSINEGNFRGVNNFPHQEPDVSNSTVQENKKKGWCYVGTDRTHRSCVKVGKQDTCMSGKIFPTNQICINPSLRQ